MTRMGLMLFLTGLLWFETRGQELRWHYVTSVEVEGLDHISLDNRGSLLYSDKGGNVFKLTGKGESGNNYSPSFQGRLHQLEAFWPSHIFLFSADLQLITLLDVFLSPITTFSIQNDHIDRIGTATLGSNQVVWIFDEIGLTLIQYDYVKDEIQQKQPLFNLLEMGNIEIAELLERQNLLFMNSRTQGVFIFDNQGNFIKRLAIDLEQKLSIHNDHLYYVAEDTIHQVNFVTGQVRVLEPPPHYHNSILVNGEQVIFYSDSSIVIYEQPSL